MNHKFSSHKVFLALILSGFMLSGCGFLLGAAAGGVVGNEIGEDDGEFDPGEDVDRGIENAEEAIED